MNIERVRYLISKLENGKKLEKREIQEIHFDLLKQSDREYQLEKK